MSQVLFIAVILAIVIAYAMQSIFAKPRPTASGPAPPGIVAQTVARAAPAGQTLVPAAATTYPSDVPEWAKQLPRYSSVAEIPSCGTARDMRPIGSEFIPPPGPKESSPNWWLLESFRNPVLITPPGQPSLISWCKAPKKKGLLSGIVGSVINAYTGGLTAPLTAKLNFDCKNPGCSCESCSLKGSCRASRA